MTWLERMQEWLSRFRQTIQEQSRIVDSLSQAVAEEMREVPTDEVPETRAQAGEVTYVEVTPDSHVLIECAGRRVFFPRYKLSDGELEVVAEAVKMVTGTLHPSYGSEREQNLFSPLRDYWGPVEHYLQGHPALQGWDPMRQEKTSEGWLVMNGVAIPDQADREAKGFSPHLLIGLMAAIAQTGDVDYLAPLSKGKPGVGVPGGHWKPATLQVRGWWGVGKFQMSGHAATTLTRMGYNLEYSSNHDALVVPIYYDERSRIPQNPTTGRYEHSGCDAGVTYLEEWMHPNGKEKSDRHDWANVGSWNYVNHSGAYFPPPEKCLFIDREGSVTVGPPEQATGSTLEVDGYAIRLQDGGWAEARDHGQPDMYKGQPRQFVFHPLALKEVLYCMHPGPEKKAQIVPAIFRPGEGVKLLGKEQPFVQYLCNLFPCYRCGKQRKTNGQCAVAYCSGYYCEHCVVKSGGKKFCSEQCAEQDRGREAKKAETARFKTL